MRRDLLARRTDSGWRALTPPRLVVPDHDGKLVEPLEFRRAGQVDRHDDTAEPARITGMISRAAVIDGDLRQAAALAHESLAGYKKAGNRHGMAAPLERLSEIAYHRGDLQAARGHIEEALGLVRGTCKVCTENLISDLAQVLTAQDDDPAAVRTLLAERDRLRVELGLPGGRPWTI